MSRNFIRQIINLLAVLATIAVNGLANVLPLNGLNTGEISDRFTVYFVPAGYVFSIWGLIYLGLIAYAVFQLLPSQRENPRLLRIGYLPALSCLFNIVWLFLWHYEQFLLTLLAMIGLLLTLIAIYLRLDIGRTSVGTAERWCLHIPFSVYLGWVTVATVANVTSVLDFLGWGGWGLSEAAWAVIMLLVAAGIGVLMGLRHRDAAFLLVLVWAFVGIALKHAGTSSVVAAAWAAALIAGGMAVYSLLRGRKKGLQRAGA
jgi:hypothetical protein